jgi:hypothetical protein
MKVLHIVQGGITNGDKKWLERAAKRGWCSKSWVAPKAAQPGDEVVIYVAGYGFFATARITSYASLRADRQSRYGATLDSIRLIKPAISLATILRKVSALKWANYPRSITTPPPCIAAQIRALIRRRRKTGLPDLDEASLKAANIDELRRVALMSARQISARKKRETYHRIR